MKIQRTIHTSGWRIRSIQLGVAAAALLCGRFALAEQPFGLGFDHPVQAKVTVEVTSKGDIFVGGVDNVINIGSLTGSIWLTHPGHSPVKDPVLLDGEAKFDIGLLLDDVIAIARARVFYSSGYSTIVGGNPLMWAKFTKANGDPIDVNGDGDATNDTFYLGRLKKGAKLTKLVDFLSEAVLLGKVSGEGCSPAGPDRPTEVKVNLSDEITIGGLNIEITLANNTKLTHHAEVHASAVILEPQGEFSGAAEKRLVSGNPLVTFVVHTKNDGDVEVFAIRCNEL